MPNSFDLPLFVSGTKDVIDTIRGSDIGDLLNVLLLIFIGAGVLFILFKQAKEETKSHG